MFICIVATVLSFIAAYAGSSQSWVIEGDKVYVDDANVFIQAEPHTITGSGSVLFNFTPKAYTGDVDVVWGFDTDEARPTAAWLYSPHEIATTHSYTCNDDYFNYTVNPNRFWCWDNVTEYFHDNATNTTTETGWHYELVKEGEFEWGDIPTKTAYWTTSRIEDYKEISGAFQNVDYAYGGMDKWWFKKNVPVVAGNNYQVKIDMRVPIKLGGFSGKYWFAIKPSSETIQEAIASGHLYYLDPWWNASWTKKKTITITENAGQTLWNYSMPFNVTYEASMQNDFEDLRFVNTTDDELPLWVEKKVDGSWAYVWVLMGYIQAGTSAKTIDMYYGNAGVASVSDIDAVSIIGIDCEDNWAGDWTGSGLVECQDVTILAGTKSVLYNVTSAWAYDYMIDDTIPENYTFIFWLQDDGTSQSQLGPHLADGVEAGDAMRWYSRVTGDARFAQFDGGYTYGSANAGNTLYRIEHTGPTPATTTSFKSYVNYISTADISSNDLGAPTDLDRISLTQAGAFATYLDQMAIFKSTGDKATEPTYSFGAEEGPPVISSPQYSNNLTQLGTPQTYSIGKEYGFQIDWENADNVTFESDFTGANTNYTMYSPNYIKNTSTTTYWINFTQGNITTAAHSYKWYAANDTAENATESVAYTITQATSNAVLSVLPATPITYGTATTAYCAEDSPEAVGVLERNSSDVTSENDTAITLGAGSYNYTCSVSVTENYTADSESVAYLINKNDTNNIHSKLWVWVYPYVVYDGGGPRTDLNASWTYNSQASVYFYFNRYATDSYNMVLYRNDTQIATSCQTGAGTCTFNSSSIDDTMSDFEGIWNQTLLGAGQYNFTAYKPETENYTAFTRDVWHTVNTNTSTSIDMYLNGTENADYSATWPADINATCMINRVTENAFTMVRNGTVVGTQVAAVTSYEDDLATGSYNFTCNYTAANYSAYSRTQYFTLNKATASINLYLNGTEADRTMLNGTAINLTAATDLTGQLVSIAANISGWETQSAATSVSNTTVWSIATVPQTYNITANMSGANFTSSPVTYYLTLDDVEVDAESYDPNILENSTQTISAVFGYPTDAKDLYGTLIWNDTVYANDTVTMNDTHITLAKTLTLPTITGDTESVDFFWNYSYDSHEHINRTSAVNSQLIHKPTITQCNDTYNTSSVNIDFRDENDTAFPYVNATAELYLEFDVSGTVYTYNNSFTNNTIDLCIFPAWANYSVDGGLTYDNSSYTYRIYTFDSDIFDNTTEQMDMLLIDAVLAPKLVKISVKDEYGNAYPNVVVKAQRWYNSLGIYKTAAAPKTDISGDAFTYLHLDNAEYRFLLYKDGALLKTIEKMIIPNVAADDPIILEFMITFDEIVEWLIFKDKITGTCSYANVTGNLTCTYTDTSSTVKLSQVQLTVKRYIGALQSSVIYSGTNTSVPTGSFVVHLGNETAQTSFYDYKMLGKLTINENEYFIIYQGVLDLGAGTSKLFGDCRAAGNIAKCREGAVITFLLTLMSALVGTMSPAVSMLMMLTGLGVASATGLWAMSMQTLIGMVFVAGVIIYRMRSR